MRTWPKFRSVKYYKDAFYPDSYFGKVLGSQQMPIFLYHALTPDEFEKHLRFLKENGYQAVSCEEAPWDMPDPKKVILTFDDGRRSVWSVAYPLLKKYGFKGTAFISPGLIQYGEVTPNLDNTSETELSRNDFGNTELFNWEEASEMHESGVIDLQLHGFAHSRIFVSGDIETYANPSINDMDLGISAWQLAENNDDAFIEQFKFGQPIYKSGSRWGERLRYFDDQKLRKACIDYVDLNNKDDKFFLLPSWQDELNKVVQEYREINGNTGRTESKQEQRNNLIKLLSDAKQILESKTGKIAEHFALPWAKGDKQLVTEVARIVGVNHIYWEHLTETTATNNHEKLIRHHPRLKDVFLLRLKGNGSQNIASFVLDEFLRIRYDKRKE